MNWNAASHHDAADKTARVGFVKSKCESRRFAADRESVSPTSKLAIVLILRNKQSAAGV